VAVINYLLAAITKGQREDEELIIGPLPFAMRAKF
jgi:hypothetical protein